MRPTVGHVPREHALATLELSLGLTERVDPSMSARTRTSRSQRSAFVGAAVVLGALAVWRPAGTVTALAAAAVVVYLAIIVHRATLFATSLRADVAERVSDEEARAVLDDELPTYTVLVPAFREPEVMPDLVASLAAIEYPRDRMLVMLLLEEEDDATLQAAQAIDTDLPITIVVVPPGAPQTKPRALNYGFVLSDSELVTVYDAEDRPDPLQLRRAAVAMARGGPDLACLQARLGFYDADRNLLSKWFCIEYLTWFTHLLPGMAARHGVVPLGGTSNHFRRSALRDVGAWDPYNVTEDADLGIRLQRAGHRIGVLDSVTYEEPNSDVINWIKQRSRWQKGYIQTALVHLRHPRRLVAEIGWRGLGHLLLFVGGTPVLAVLNLYFWMLWLVYAVTRARFIELMFPGMSLYLALAAWAIGNFMVAYLGVVTLLDTRRPDLLIAALLVPCYWVLISIAALRALIQFVVDPSYWEKTQHGLHRPSPVIDLTEPTIDLRPSRPSRPSPSTKETIAS